MRPFWLQRVEDESGVSGVGLVAEGVLFSNGWCSLTWLTGHKSVAVARRYIRDGSLFRANAAATVGL